MIRTLDNYLEEGDSLSVGLADLGRCVLDATCYFDLTGRVTPPAVTDLPGKTLTCHIEGKGITFDRVWNRHIKPSSIKVAFADHVKPKVSAKTGAVSSERWDAIEDGTSVDYDPWRIGREAATRVVEVGAAAEDVEAALIAAGMSAGDAEATARKVLADSKAKREA